MTEYEQKILKAVRDIHEKTKNGASPGEVAALMSERKELAALDSTLDIRDQMESLRERGLL